MTPSCLRSGRAGRAGVARREQFTVDVPSLDSANVASGVSRALAALADRIAAQLL